MTFVKKNDNNKRGANVIKKKKKEFEGIKFNLRDLKAPQKKKGGIKK